MAFLPNQPTDNTDPNNPSSQKNNMVNAGSSAPITATGGASPTSGTGNQGISVAKPSSSGRFTNISNYIKANQGFNQEGGGLAGSIASNINQQAQQAQQGVQAAQNEFSTEAKKATDVYNPYATPSGQPPTSGQVVTQQPSASDYTQQVLNNSGNLTQDQIAKFTALRDAQYNGPQGLNNTQQLQSNVQNVANAANQTGTEAGRYNLLRNTFNNAGYSTGQQKLDNLLLQGDQQQLNALTGTRAAANQLQGGLNNAIQGATSQGQQYANQAQILQQDTRNALGQAVNSEQNDLQKRVTDAAAGSAAALASLQKDLTAGNITQSELGNLGISSTDLSNIPLYAGIDPSKFITPDTTQATLQNVANTQDYNKIAGLGTLAGNTANPDVNAFLQSFGDKNQAGTYASKPTLNIANLTAASKQAGDLYNSALTNTYNSFGQYNPAVWQGIVNRDATPEQNVQALQGNLAKLQTFNQNSPNVKYLVDSTKSEIASLQNLQNQYTPNRRFNLLTPGSATTAGEATPLTGAKLGSPGGAGNKAFNG